MITLKTLHQATEQEVFDQVARHLLTQNEKSFDETKEGCRYRGVNNLKCAAGCLISDDEYRSEFEDKLWGGLVYGSPIHPGYGVPSDHMELIENLQSIHDDYEVEGWRYALWDLAESRDLNTSVLDEFK